MPNSSRQHHLLNRKLVGAVLLVSSAVMLISLVVFIFREHHIASERTQQHLQQIERISLPGLSRSLWNFDHEQLQTQLDALLELPEIDHAEIQWHDWQGQPQRLQSRAVTRESDLETRVFALKYDRNDGSQEALGTLTLGITNQPIWDYTWQQSSFLAGFLLLQALLSAAIILALLRRLLTRRLAHLAHLTRKLSISSLHRRFPVSPAGDELDNIAQALNSMRERLIADIETKRKADQALLKERSLRLEQESQRRHAESVNEAKNTFMATMSHEIRTPLNGIIGILDLLKDSPLTTEQQRQMSLMMQSSESLLRIISDILDFSKMEAGELTLDVKPTALVSLLEDALCSYISHAKKKNLTLVCDIQIEQLHHVDCDAVRLRQILMNLINNAIKFTEQGYVGLFVTEEKINNQWRANIVVKDTGIGIATQQQTLVFDAFVQADQSTARHYGGTGLGLSVCRSLCQQMGGELALDSRPNRGSTFTLSLPFSPINDSPEPLPNLLGKRIKILSHHAALRESLANMLQARGARTQQGNELSLLDSLADHYFIDAALVLDQPSTVLPENSVLFGDPALLSDVGEQAARKDNTISYPQLATPVTRTALYALWKNKQLVAPSQPEKNRLPALPKRHILIAEDNVVNQDVLCAMLDSLHAGSYQLCQNGQEALEQYQKHSATFDLILMDLEMPVLDGLDAIRQIRQWEKVHDLPPCPAIALSAHLLNNLLQEADTALFDLILHKPLRKEELRKQLLAMPAPRTHSD